MKKNLTPRTILILGVVAICMFFLIPTLMGKEEIKVGPSKLSSLSLGLDLKGGMHVVLRVLVDKAISDELGLDAGRLEESFKEKKIAYNTVSMAGMSLSASFANEQAKQQGIAYMKEYWPKFKIEETGESAVNLKIDPNEVASLKQNALQQAKETIHNRIDEFAVKEPEIYTQGADQIIVRLPGVVDPTRAKALIGRTAVLEFKILERPDYFAPSKESLLQRTGGTIPVGYDIYPSGESARGHAGFYLMKKVPEVTGKDLVDARRSLDQNQGPAISFSFNSSAAKRFADITANNIGKQLAIVLDNKVMSAPTIRDRISAHGQITGDFTDQEARDLAIILRSGSLPVPVEIEEERTVGPTLGQDSIHKGLISTVVGGILVVGFMIFYYRRAGVIADLALIGNIAMILGIMALFGATLTLPGIAGIVLTIGMAVDANVIINERIREELRTGKTPRAAVEAGYDKALWAILDSNITTAVSGVVLYQFGTGPIKGFAVTLLIGLACSVFTAVTGTRLIYDYILQRRRDLKTLSI